MGGWGVGGPASSCVISSLPYGRQRPPPEKGLLATPPSARFQIQFLKDLQRLLEEGSFTATYKFALVHALADLAVQRGDDMGDELELPIRAIGERFVELYWRQVVPWPAPEGALVLAQNTGRQAAIVSRVEEARAEWGDRLDQLRARQDAWSSLTGEVSRVVSVMPLWKLQRVGREVHDFLYEHERTVGRGSETAIVLRPGVAYCFRAFHALILDLVRGAWIRFVRRLNAESLQERTELGEFLFGPQRNTLMNLRDPLLELQGGTCFYCGRALRDSSHVDHFIPWSRYPVDLGHNFVLAHDRCNGAKSDHLAALPHLERWARRNEDERYELGRVFREAGFLADEDTSRRITRWAYSQVADRNGLVWAEGRKLVPLDPGWERLSLTG